MTTTSATHLYANDTPAPKPMSGTVSDSVSSGGTGSSLTTTSNITVTEAAPTFLAWVPGTNFEGDTVSLSHSFTDPGGDTITGYSIDWNDGTVNSSFTHTYPEESTSAGYRIRVTATTTDSGTYSTVTTGAYAHIGDSALSVSAAPISANQFIQFSGNVATFTDANAHGTTSDFTGTIDWGDGTAATAATIAPNNTGGWNVSGLHTYMVNGSKTATVTINDVGGAARSAPVSATIAPPVLNSLTVTGTISGNTATVANGSSSGSIRVSTDDPLHISGIVSPNVTQAYNLALYEVENSSGAVVASGTLGTAGANYTLPSSGSYSIMAGIDVNGNGVLDGSEAVCNVAAQAATATATDATIHATGGASQDDENVRIDTGVAETWSIAKVVPTGGGGGATDITLTDSQPGPLGNTKNTYKFGGTVPPTGTTKTYAVTIKSSTGLVTTLTVTIN